MQKPDWKDYQLHLDYRIANEYGIEEAIVINKLQLLLKQIKLPEEIISKDGRGYIILIQNGLMRMNILLRDISLVSAKNRYEEYSILLLHRKF